MSQLQFFHPASVDEAVTLLAASPDNTNVPLGRAFADVGWPQTETRIDLVPA